MPTADSRPTALPLSSLRRGARGHVVAVLDEQQHIGDAQGSTVAQRLLEIGFMPGERCEVIGESWPGRDPMAVRIGNSTFALRRHEARAVMIELDVATP